MFRGRWERQARRLALHSGHSPLELRPPLCRTNLGDAAPLGPSSAVCSQLRFRELVSLSCSSETISYLQSLLPSSFLETWPLLP